MGGNALKLIALALILAVAFSAQASARKGVGIVWSTESEVVDELSTTCITYGLYNPWDEDVYAVLDVSDELKVAVTEKEAEPKLISAGTSHQNAVPVELCFVTAKAYEEDCLVDGIICEQQCKQAEVDYEGKVEANERPTGTAGGTAGSVTSLGVSVPLRLKVRCVPHPRDWTVVYAAIIIVAVIAIALLMRRRRHK